VSNKKRYETYSSVAIEETAAKNYGYEKLTLPYKEQEVTLLQRVIKDMHNVDFAIVNTRWGLEIWRKGMISHEEAAALTNS